MCGSTVAWGMNLYLACDTVTTKDSIQNVKQAWKQFYHAATLDMQ